MRIIQNETLTAEAIEKLTKDERDWIYNGLDAAVTLEIHYRQQESADDIAKATAKFSRTLAKPVFEMALRGTLVDLDARDRVLKKFREQREILKHNFYRLVREGVGFVGFDNYRSNAQIGRLFYDVMQFKAIRKRNAEGKYVPTVDRNALEKLDQHFDAQFLVGHITALRELDKRIDMLETEVDEDGRFRSSYNIAGTNTGRLSSSDSYEGTGRNQQNIERRLREVYVSDPDFILVNVDGEQADARNVGAIIWELFYDEYGPEMAGAYLDACESGDLHTTVCKMAWPDLEWPSDPKQYRAFCDVPGNWYREWSYRDGSKKLGHGTNYYGTPPTMAMHTKVEKGQIVLFQQRYFEGFPLIGSYDRDPTRKNWHNWVRAQLDQFGFIITPHFSRRRYFFGRPDDDRTLREAIAYAPQSMTADEVDQGMIQVWEWKAREKIDIRFHIQVHDSALFSVPIKEAHELIPLVIEHMKVEWELKGGRKFQVPLEAKVGYNWRDFDKNENLAGLVKYKPLMDLQSRPAFRAGPQPRRSIQALLV
jgi:DNA polymerase-1